MKKSFYLAAILLIGVLFMGSPVHASENLSTITNSTVIRPLYSNINDVYTSLTINDGIATIKGYVQRTSSGNSIYLSSTLQRYNNGLWIDVESWSKTTTSFSASISEKSEVGKGSYRVRTYYSVDGNGGTETGTIYSKEITY